MIRTSGLIVVMRGIDPDTAIKTADALYEAGVRVLEVTVDSPGALQTIRKMSAALDGRALVGAGTVLDAGAAAAAIQSGAQFLFAPNLNVDVVKTAARFGKVAIPGVFTPTEMMQAAEAGAQVVKLFPAAAVGPGFIRQVSAPLPHIPIVPTGGINEENVGEYIECGAFAVGVGASLLRDHPQNGRFDVVRDGAARLLQRIAAARG